VSGGTPSKSREDYWIGDVPWVSPKDIKRIGIRGSIDYVNSKILAETNIKLVPVNSILIVVRGMILVHTVPVAVALTPLTINQDMKALIPKPEINSIFLLWLMKVLQPQLLEKVSTAAHGTKKLRPNASRVSRSFCLHLRDSLNSFSKLPK
jgi:type I restriction enzyme S subunit